MASSVSFSLCRVYKTDHEIFYRIHVRLTDKVNTEAKAHKIEEYMKWVEAYYQKIELSQAVKRRRVFLATDDATVLKYAMDT